MSRSDENYADETRRRFLARGVDAAKWAATASLLAGEGLGSFASAAEASRPSRAHFPGKAKHVIYLHMVGAPSQIDLFDYKPKMDAWYDKDLPDSIRQGQRLDDHDFRPGEVSHRPLEIQVRPAWAERHVG